MRLTKEQRELKELERTEFLKYANTNEILVTRDNQKTSRLLRWMSQVANITGVCVSVHLAENKQQAQSWPLELLCITAHPSNN